MNLKAEMKDKEYNGMRKAKEKKVCFGALHSKEHNKRIGVDV